MKLGAAVSVCWTLPAASAEFSVGALPGSGALSSSLRDSASSERLTESSVLISCALLSAPAFGALSALPAERASVFPDTSEPVREKKFSMVNLDVDCYESTKQCLLFFYPRMSPGGIILSHDYITAPGVKKAFDDFFETRAEPVLETAGSQCLVVKV